MKYLLVVVVVFVAIWLWRKNRRDELRARPVPPRNAAPPAVAAPLAMTRCAQCGMHLPESDAVRGQRGVYCSAAHRQATES